ncbi:hypothetical protein C8F04DRAFT_1237046 [Mycena alexandri]|uniref:Uncharacterized protein n=1 Tax=Mycena alexandri TaxID=1745969 RepID=A0AAD6SK49_9AGAR|nr:hypothetical protein C8F04DRAFT_1237046 [Mycena alexandri]
MGAVHPGGTLSRLGHSKWSFERARTRMRMTQTASFHLPPPPCLLRAPLKTRTQFCGWGWSWEWALRRSVFGCGCGAQWGGRDAPPRLRGAAWLPVVVPVESQSACAGLALGTRTLMEVEVGCERAVPVGGQTRERGQATMPGGVAAYALGSLECGRCSQSYARWTAVGVQWSRVLVLRTSAWRRRSRPPRSAPTLPAPSFLGDARRGDSEQRARARAADGGVAEGVGLSVRRACSSAVTDVRRQMDAVGGAGRGRSAHALLARGGVRARGRVVRTRTQTRAMSASPVRVEQDGGGAHSTGWRCTLALLAGCRSGGFGAAHVCAG